MITEQEIATAKWCISHAVINGASGIRVSFAKNVQDSCTYLNGEIDKVTHSADRSIYLTLFVDGRYGTFSTNKTATDELGPFILQAIEMTRMLGEDRCRRLPDPGRTARNATAGTELGLYDGKAAGEDASKRLEAAKGLSLFKGFEAGQEFELVSEECEYGESIEDTLLLDSNGFEGRHKETSFSCFCEVTIRDKDGNRYSGHHWEASPQYSSLNTEGCARKALEKAAGQIGPKKRKSGTYRMIVDRNVSSRLVAPLLNALNAQSIQQKVSFLEGTEGKKIFSEGLGIVDYARAYGKPGARMYDYEGVATEERAVIDKGVVWMYFTSTYMSEKSGMKPTVDGVSHPVLLPYLDTRGLDNPKKDVTLKDILSRCKNGIYVTGFNGGNCNPVTGDFSFGIEGFAVRKGKIAHPVKEMLITGNMIELWNGFIAAGSDARCASRWEIPTLAFDGVSFSG